MSTTSPVAARPGRRPPFLVISRGVARPVRSTVVAASGLSGTVAGHGGLAGDTLARGRALACCRARRLTHILPLGCAYLAVLEVVLAAAAGAAAARLGCSCVCWCRRRGRRCWLGCSTLRGCCLPAVAATLVLVLLALTVFVLRLVLAAVLVVLVLAALVPVGAALLAVAATLPAAAAAALASGWLLATVVPAGGEGAWPRLGMGMRGAGRGCRRGRCWGGAAHRGACARLRAHTCPPACRLRRQRVPHRHWRHQTCQAS
jgi:hypothetical protein